MIYQQKKFISKILFLFAFVFFLMVPFLFNKPVFAVIGFDTDKKLSTTTELGNTDPATMTYSIINYALMFLGLITVIMIIIAGFLWMFAAGNEQKMEKARGILVGAILGLIIVMASYGAAQYIFTKLIGITTGTTSSGSSTTPSTGGTTGVEVPIPTEPES